MIDNYEDHIRFYVLDRTTRQTVRLTDDGSGDPLVVQWARILGDMGTDARRVAWDDIHDMGLHVSTVFMGFDMMHDCGLHRVPLLFETMVFDQEGPVGDRISTATLDDAERAHAAMVAQLRAGVRP